MESPVVSRKIPLVVCCLVGGALVIGAILAVIAYQFVAPAMRPMMNVRSAIARAHPAYKCRVGVQWVNGRKIFDVSLSAPISLSSDAAQAKQTADDVARLVRENYDLTSYDSISVKIERGVSAGIGHAKSVQNFDYPL